MRFITSSIRIIVVSAIVVSAFVVPSSAHARECPWEPVAESTLRQYEQTMYAMLNDARAARGFPRLPLDPQLTSIARQHAKRMAADHSAYHNHSFLGNPARVGARSVGEALGKGSCSPEGAHESLMGSPNDRHQMMAAGWDAAGIGIASDDAGVLYYVEDFAQREAASSAGEPSPAMQPAAPAHQTGSRPAPHRPSETTAPSPAPTPRPETPSATESAAEPEPVSVPTVEFDVVRQGVTALEPVQEAAATDEHVGLVAAAAMVAAVLFGLFTRRVRMRPGHPRKRGT